MGKMLKGRGEMKWNENRIEPILHVQANLPRLFPAAELENGWKPGSCLVFWAAVKGNKTSIQNSIVQESTLSILAERTVIVVVSITEPQKALNALFQPPRVRLSFSR